MDPELRRAVRPPRFTIGRAMVLIAASAVLLTIARSGFAAVVISSLVGFYYVVLRHGAITEGQAKLGGETRGLGDPM